MRVSVYIPLPSAPSDRAMMMLVANFAMNTMTEAKKNVVLPRRMLDLPEYVSSIADSYSIILIQGYLGTNKTNYDLVI